MHVLIVPSEHFVTSGYPLGGIFQFHQANALRAAGLKVGVIAPGVISPRFALRRYPYRRFERVNDYPVLRHYVRRYFPQRWRGYKTQIPLFRELGKKLFDQYIRREGVPDLIHAHNVEYAGYVAEAIANVHGVPYVITEHSGRLIVEKPSAEDAAVMAGCLESAGAVRAVSSALARAMTAATSVEGIGVLPNIVDEQLLQTPLVPARLDAPVVFLSIGSLDDNKNHESLITAFAGRFRNSTATLRIGGTGPLRAHLEEIARRLGVTEQARFLGHLERLQVAKELQNATCLILNSKYESFGVVVIEALACGRPVIATRCGGPEDVVTPSAGLLVDRDDTGALADAMQQIADTRANYDAESLRADCVARFGPEAFVARAVDMYKAVVEQRG